MPFLRPSINLMKYFTLATAGGGADDCFCYDTCPPIYDATKPNFAIYTGNTVSRPSCLLFARLVHGDGKW